jgi:hypothetical protein
MLMENYTYPYHDADDQMRSKEASQLQNLRYERSKEQKPNIGIRWNTTPLSVDLMKIQGHGQSGEPCMSSYYLPCGPLK